MTTPQEMEERLEDLRRIGIACAEMANSKAAVNVAATEKIALENFTQGPPVTAP